MAEKQSASERGVSATRKTRPKSTPQKKTTAPAPTQRVRAALVDFPITRGDFDAVVMRSPDTLLSYELIVLRPIASFDKYVAMGSEFNGLPSLTDSMSRYIVQDSTHRKAELTELLRAGATVVVVEPCLMPSFVGTGNRSHSGTGKNRQTIRLVDEFEFWDALMPVKIPLAIGRGKDLQFTDHQVAVPLRKLSDRLSYESYVPSDDLIPIAHIPGKKIAVAGIKRVGRGHLVLIPGIRNQQQFATEADWLGAYNDFLNAILEIHKRLKPAAISELPDWAKQIATDAELQKRRDLEARLAAVEAEQGRVEETRRELMIFDQRKLLLTSSGKTLERAVAATLERLGCEVECRDDDRTDLIIRLGEQIAVAEVKGLNGSAGENNAAQAEKWVSMYHADHGIEPKGMLIVNTFREQPILVRNRVSFPNQMMKYVQKKELVLITTAQLFVADALMQTEPDRVERFCESLFSAVGEVQEFGDIAEVLQALTTASS